MDAGSGVYSCDICGIICGYVYTVWCIKRCGAYLYYMGVCVYRVVHVVIPFIYYIYISVCDDTVVFSVEAE